jgi:3-phytase
MGSVEYLLDARNPLKVKAMLDRTATSSHKQSQANSLMISTLLATSLFVQFYVSAIVETDASPYPADSLDDVAIWTNPVNADNSLIIVTLKASNVRPVLPTGILVYDMDGRQIQFLPGGTPNSIDIRPGFPSPEGSFSLIAASHWWSNEVGLYRIDPKTLKLVQLNALFETSLEEVRGLCMYHDRGKDEFYYFVSNERGQVEQYLIESINKVKKVREFSIGSGTEGCVVDDKTSTLYLSEEEYGIWRMSAQATAHTERKPVDEISWFGPLQRDIEGLTTIDDYLIASVQGRDAYVVYDKVNNEYLATFAITNGQVKSEGYNDAIDKVSGSDGITVSSQPLGRKFPNGVFIAHDDVNSGDEGFESLNQNFKLVPWEKILEQLEIIRSNP